MTTTPEPEPTEPEEPESEGGETDEPETETEEADTAEHRIGELLKTKAGDLDDGPLSEVFDQDRPWSFVPGRDLDHEPAGHTPETTAVEL
jgi:hypothetical protein